MMMEAFANKMTDTLCRCRKVKWSNGEKKLYSGYMNHWLKYVDCRGKDMWCFTYKQKKIYNFDMLSKEYKFSLTKREKLDWLEHNEWYYFPLCVYGCAFMSCRIVDHGNYSLLIWSTGDDDSGYDFMFPSKDLDKIKKFIESNFKLTSFAAEICCLLEQEGYSRY